MSRLVLRPHGVEVALNYLINTDDELAAKKLNHIARIILTTPSDTDAETYIRTVCQTLLGILKSQWRKQQGSDNKGKSIANNNSKDEEERNERQLKASVYLLNQISIKRPKSFTEHVKNPILEPLENWWKQKIIDVAPSGRTEVDSELGLEKLRLPQEISLPNKKKPLIQIIEPAVKKKEEPKESQKETAFKNDRIISTGEELTNCIRFLHSMLAENMPLNQLVSELVFRVFVPLFNFYSFICMEKKTTQNADTKSKMESTSKFLSEILSTYFERESKTQAIESVKKLVYTVRGEGSLSNVNDNEHDPQQIFVPIFEITKDGSVVLCWPSTDIIDNPTSTEADEDEDVMQKKLNLDTFVDFFSGTDRIDLASHVFVALLQDYIARWELYIESTQTANNPIIESITSQAERYRQIGRWWLASQALMAMVENLGPKILNQRPAQILGVLQIILDRIASNPPVGVEQQQSFASGTADKSPSSIMDKLNNMLKGQHQQQKTGEEAMEDIEDQVGDINETVLVALSILSVLISQPPTDNITKWDNQAIKLLQQVCKNVEKLSEIYAKASIVTGLASEILMQSRIFQTLFAIAATTTTVALSDEDILSTSLSEDQKEKHSASSTYIQAMHDLQDDSVPVKAHRLSHIATAGT